jgi:hypothetical protein
MEIAGFLGQLSIVDYRSNGSVEFGGTTGKDLRVIVWPLDERLISEVVVARNTQRIV